MKLFSIFFLIICINYQGLSQQDRFTIQRGSGQLIGDFVSMEMTTSERMKNIQGSMYAFEQFLPCRIINSKNQETPFI